MQLKLYLYLLVIFLFTACGVFEGSYEHDLIDKDESGFFNPEDGSYSDIDQSYYSQEDSYYNLVIANTIEDDLFLYINGSLDRIIPIGHNYFRIFIDAESNQVTNLKIFKAKEISKEEAQSPPSAKTFKQWDVILSGTQNNAVKWMISDDEESSDKSVVNFHYPTHNIDGTPNEYNVDIYLNSKLGSKLGSLVPGSSSDFLLEYGLHVLVFKYWYSDNESNEGSTTVGWVEKKPNGTNYSVVTNSSNPELDFDIPLYYDNYSQDVGTITIKNNTKYDLFIKANNFLLEDIIIMDGSTDGMSYVAASSDLKVKLPAEEMYFEAVRPESGKVINSTRIEVKKDGTYEWIINE